MQTEKNSFVPSADAKRHLESAYAKLANGDLPNALSECQLSIYVDANYAEVHNLRGVILEKMGRKEEALASYREAVRLDPMYTEAQENLFELETELSNGKSEEAVSSSVSEEQPPAESRVGDEPNQKSAIPKGRLTSTPVAHPVTKSRISILALIVGVGCSIIGTICCLFVLLTDLNPVGAITRNCGGQAGTMISGSGAQTGKIVFESYCTDWGIIENYEIYVINADGTNLRRLTNGGWNTSPAWSPDGQFIAFTSHGGDNKGIYVMSADGTNPRQLTNTTVRDSSPTWSPNGQFIAFTSERDNPANSYGNPEIYVMNADGTNLRRLTSNVASDSSPAWSPDGQFIAFTSNRDGNKEIYVMKADGTNPRRLTNNAVVDDSPVWPPDGQFIAFTSGRDGDYEIYAMNSDGTNPRRLTNNADSPAWSPDGQFIAFHSKRDGNDEIYVMNADGTNPRRLTYTGAWDFSPAWSPK